MRVFAIEASFPQEQAVPAAGLLIAPCVRERADIREIMATQAAHVVPRGLDSALRVSPDEWARHLSGPACLSSDSGDWSKALLRHWTGTSPDMHQPPLDHHFVVCHLGGAKRVERRGDGAPVSAIVECGALTIVPAGSEFKWRTQGPIDFAHLYILPAALAAIAARFDRANGLSLLDRVGCRDPLLESLYAAMLLELQQPGPASVLYLDSLLETFLLKLVRDHSSAALRGARRCESLPAFRLRHVIEFVEAHLGDQLTLADLARVAGGSVFHFSRAFKNAVGQPPYRYVVRRRVAKAKLLLTNGDLPLQAVASACGFHRAAGLARAFSRLVGVSPEQYRRR